MRRSLNRRLIGILSAVTLSAWLATAFFSYLDARQKIDEVLDANLEQAALLLHGLLQRPGLEAGAMAEAAASGDAAVAFRAVDGAGRSILQSPAFPAVPAVLGDGFADLTLDGVRWRLFGFRGAGDGRLIQVAERYSPRSELARSVVSHLLHPVWIALPILAVLIWMSVQWGLAPLSSLAREVERRDPARLEPLDDGTTPQEVRPLTRALNALFDRVSSMQERERRFAADAAHELRTPLAAIRTHAEVARAAGQPGERRRALDNVLKGADRAAHLVDQLLILARLDPEDPLPSATRLQLTEVAAGAVAECAPLAAAAGVDLGLTPPDGPVAMIDGDAELLAILARNLVDNAVRYVGTGGTVDVAVGRSGPRVGLFVADNGPGLPAAERQRMFDRFYRKLGTGQAGAGLGLSIVARIAALHGASVAVDAGIGGRGLRVAVMFPAAAPRMPA